MNVNADRAHSFFSRVHDRIDHPDQESITKDFGYGALIGTLTYSLGVAMIGLFSPPPRDFLAPLSFRGVAVMGLSVGLFDAIWTLSSKILFNKFTKDQIDPFTRQILISPLISLVATPIITGVCATCISGDLATGGIVAGLTVGSIAASYMTKMFYGILAMGMEKMAKDIAAIDATGKKEIAWQFVKGSAIGSLACLGINFCIYALSSQPKGIFWSKIPPESVALWGLSVGIFDSLWELFDNILLKAEKEDFEKAMKGVLRIKNTYKQHSWYNRVDNNHTVEQRGIHYVVSPILAIINTALVAKIVAICIGGADCGETYTWLPIIVVPLTYSARKTVAACNYVFRRVGSCVWGNRAVA